MKRFYIFVMAAGLFVAGGWFSNAEANGKLDEVLANMQREAKKIKTLYAELQQEKRYAKIGGKDISRGKLFFKHAGPNNDKVKVIYSVPAGQEVSVIGDEITLCQANIKQCIITSRKSASSGNQEFAFFATPYGLTTAQIKSRYDVVLVGDEPSTAVIELTPKAQSSIQKMKWWVDKSSWLPTRSEMVEKNGDISTFVLSGIKPNSVMTDSSFKIKIPGDFKKIRK